MRRITRRGGEGMTRTRKRTLSLVVLLCALAGCDSGPEGPGFMEGVVDGPIPLGAAIVEVQGDGVIGFEGAGSTHVFPGPPAQGVHRVVLVGETPGSLTFRVQVQELRDGAPSATVLSAAGGDNIPLATVQAFEVRITP